MEGNECINMQKSMKFREKTAMGPELILSNIMCLNTSGVITKTSFEQRGMPNQDYQSFGPKQNYQNTFPNRYITLKYAKISLATSKDMGNFSYLSACVVYSDLVCIGHLG